MPAGVCYWSRSLAGAIVPPKIDGPVVSTLRIRVKVAEFGLFQLGEDRMKIELVRKNFRNTPLYREKLPPLVIRRIPAARRR
jgi:hypothetical protein